MLIHQADCGLFILIEVSETSSPPSNYKPTGENNEEVSIRKAPEAS
jgi:hypothetical protein